MTWQGRGWEGESRSLGIALPTANFGGLDTWISLHCYLNRHVLLLNDMRQEVTTEDFSLEELSSFHNGKTGSTWNNSTASAEEHWYLLHQALYLALYILDVIHSLHGTIIPILQKRELTFNTPRWGFWGNTEASNSGTNHQHRHLHRHKRKDQERVFWLRIHQLVLEKVLSLTSDAQMFCLFNCSLLFV